MKICVFATSLAETGGIESHLVRFCEVMAQRGHSITFVCGNMHLNAAWDKGLRANARCICARIKNSRLRALWLICVQQVLKLSNHDVLYTNGQGDSVLLFASHFRAKTWAHHHHMSGDIEDRRHWAGSYTKALRHCDRLVACARTNAANLNSACGRVVDVIGYFTRDASISKPKDFSGRKLRFGYYGRLIAAKGLNTIIKLAIDPRLQRVEWHVWGASGDFDRQTLIDAPNVRFHGSFASVEQLHGVLERLDCLTLFSTFTEGQPVSLIEAMAAGLPWIATDRGGVVDILTSSNANMMLSPNPSYEECAAACQRMAQVLMSGESDVETLKETFAKNFSTGSLAGKWETAFLPEKPACAHSTSGVAVK
jgi:glycosyltransferase involved in cell wall biosynthesis